MVFNGVVNANGYSTSIIFEYGTSTSYGNTITATTSPLSSTSNKTVVSTSITDLTVGTVYHVRMVVENVFGTFYSNDITFTNLYYGASYLGGLVVTFDNSGNGLVCASTDQSTSATWATAVSTCYNLTLNSYSDWYLPSKYELNLMYINLKAQGLGGFASAYYWSSIEYSSDFVWVQTFGNGNQHYFSKDCPLKVRAVRGFNNSTI